MLVRCPVSAADAAVPSASRYCWRLGARAPMLVARCRYSAWSWRVAVGQRCLGLRCYLLSGYSTGCFLALDRAYALFLWLLCYLLLIHSFFFLQITRRRHLQGPSSSLNPTAATKCSAAGAATGLGLVGRRIISQDLFYLVASFY